ncbi:MAG: hypothetical protein ACRD4B_06000 [Acidobacteriota bacterium]
MVGPLLKSLVKAGVYFGLAKLLLHGGQAEYQVKRFAVGTLLSLFAAVAGAVALVLLIGSVFLYLAELATLAQAALITAILAGLGGALLAWEGMRSFRIPNRQTYNTRRTMRR